MSDTYLLWDAYGGGPASPDEATLVRAVRDRLVEHGPATEDELAEDPQPVAADPDAG